MTFRPHEHVRKRVDFEAAYESGAKVNGRLMTMFVRINQREHARLGIAATRKIGNAVIRNRAKRLSRELFRSHRPQAGLDIIVVPRRQFLDAPYPSLEREFTALLERATSWAARGPASRRPHGPRPGGPRRAGADPRV